MGTKTGELLKAIVGQLVESAEYSFDVIDAFLMSMGSARILARNMHMIDRKYYSSMQCLERSGYIKKIENNQFLITAKGIKRARILSIEQPRKINQRNWDGFWRMVIFDLPNDMSGKRDIFRAVIKRNGFLGLQKSVYVSPFADFEELAFLRNELGIEKYVTFMIARIAPTDDDRHLKGRFGLK